YSCSCCVFFFFQAEDGIRDDLVTGVQTCALPISLDNRLRHPALGTRPAASDCQALGGEVGCGLAKLAWIIHARGNNRVEQGFSPAGGRLNRKLPRGMKPTCHTPQMQA